MPELTPSNREADPAWFNPGEGTLVYEFVNRPVPTTPGGHVMGGHFPWPVTSTGTVMLTAEQASMLLEGIDWRMPQRTWRPSAT